MSGLFCADERFREHDTGPGHPERPARIDAASDGVLAYVAGPQAREVGLAALAPLHQHDAEHDTELVRTLRAWLEADAVIEAAARTLGVHRHTVRARIGLAERLLQRDLGGFAARADVWAALVATR